MEKINEFSTFDDDIKKVLTKKGFKYLAQGVDQQAYIAPNGHVLKIFGTQKGTSGNSFTADHQMFFTWANYCIKNKKNPFLPNFGKFHSFVFNGRTYLQIWQERLHHSKYNEDIETMADLADNGFDVQDIFEKCKFGDEDMFKMTGLIRLVGEKNLLLLIQTVCELRDIGVRSGYGWDLHCGNSMARQNGCPVITDPWVCGDEDDSSGSYWNWDD